MRQARLVLVFTLALLLALIPTKSARAFALFQEHSPETSQRSDDHKSLGGELAEKEREAEGEEENQNLKHSTLVKKFAKAAARAAPVADKVEA